jgi:hypothetical protein
MHEHYKKLKQYAKDAKKSAFPWSVYERPRFTGGDMKQLGSDSEFMENLDTVSRLPRADEILNPSIIRKIPVDMEVLLNARILCGFDDGETNSCVGFLEGMDITNILNTNTPYLTSSTNWAHCRPLDFWNCSINFRSNVGAEIASFVHDIGIAGFKVECNYRADNSIASFRIYGTKPTHCMPWEV